MTSIGLFLHWFKLPLQRTFWRFDIRLSKAWFTSVTKRFKSKKFGSVVFVGAGCGDPELLTIKALKALKNADVVLIDWLVNPEISAMIPNHVKVIFVGKRCGLHSMPQCDINTLLVKLALDGKTVVRLKGGDPSIFGRLAEETETLTKQHIPFQVIPGITAAIGSAAYSGIPLTHRECAQSVKFITGHLKDDGVIGEWQYLAKEKGTLVFYMGLNRVDDICRQLVVHGMLSTTKIAVIDQATSEHQKVVISTISEFESKQLIAHFNGPAMIIVGDVINYKARVSVDLLTQISFNNLTSLR